MGFLVRAFAVLNGAREWFSFANEAVSILGVAKRAAVVSAGIAAGAAVITPIIHMTKQPAHPPATTQAQAVDESEVQSRIEKIDASNIYSKLYLEQPEHRTLLEAIISKCKTSNEIAANQCDIAVAAKKSVAAMEREAAFRAAFRRAAQQQETGGSTIKLPTEQTLVK